MNSTIRKTPTTPLAACGPDGLALIGRTRYDLMGIRYRQSGGTGEGAGAAGGTDAGAGGAGAGAGAGGDNGAGAGAGAGGAGAGAGAGNGATGTGSTAASSTAASAAETPPAINPATGVAYTPAETQAYIATIRQEAQQHRTLAATEKQRADDAEASRNAVLAALGLNPDGTQASKTADELAAEATQYKSSADKVARENLVLRTASTAVPGSTINVDRLLDSVQFQTKLAGVNPDDRAGVETLIREFVGTDDSYKVTSAASSSGGTTHTGTTPTDKRKSMEEAVSANYGTGSTAT